jgi:hypothetical protein
VVTGAAYGPVPTVPVLDVNPVVAPTTVKFVGVVGEAVGDQPVAAPTAVDGVGLTVADALSERSAAEVPLHGTEVQVFVTARATPAAATTMTNATITSKMVRLINASHY